MKYVSMLGKNSIQKNSNRKQVLGAICGVLFLALTLLIIYLANRAVPIMMDDNWYSTRLFDGEPIRGLRDVVDAQVWHFFNWGGRSIAHGMLQLVLMRGAFWADIINMIFNVLLTALICRMTKVHGCVPFAMVLGLLYGLNANWKESMCWQSGAANYLYMTTFILFFLWCYVRVLEGKEKPFPGAAVWMFPLGLIAGWSNENMGPAVWVLSLGIIIYCWVKKRALHLWMIMGNITCLIGSVMVIAAPGNFVRARENADEKGVLWQFFLRCYSESKAAFEYLFPTLFVLAVALAVGVGILGIKLSKATAVYLLGAVLSWGAMILSPHYPDRATFGTMVFMICALVSVAGEIIRKRTELKAWTYILGSVVWLHGMFFLTEYICTIWGWIK